MHKANDPFQLRALHDSYEAFSILPALQLVLRGRLNPVALGRNSIVSLLTQFHPLGDIVLTVVNCSLCGGDTLHGARPAFPARDDGDYS